MQLKREERVRVRVRTGARARICVRVHVCVCVRVCVCACVLLVCLTHHNPPVLLPGGEVFYRSHPRQGKAQTDLRDLADPRHHRLDHRRGGDKIYIILLLNRKSCTPYYQRWYQQSDVRAFW